MGLFNIWGGDNISIKRKVIKEEPMTSSEILDKTAATFKQKKDKAKAQRIALMSKKAALKGKQLGIEARIGLPKSRKSFTQFGERPPQEDFSFQQDVLRQTIGGRGDKIWGTNQQPVTMFNDLNPRQRGDTSTGELFGF